MYLLRVVYVRVGFAIFKIYRVMIKIRPGNWLFLTASGTNDMYITNGIVRVSGGWHVIMSCPCVARHGVSCLAPRQYSNPSQITLRCYKLYLEATLVWYCSQFQGRNCQHYAPETLSWCYWESPAAASPGASQMRRGHQDGFTIRSYQSCIHSETSRTFYFIAHI